MWKKTGTTVLFITHNIEEAVYLSQKIMVLTNKPTSVKTVLDNPLPLPRDVVFTGICRASQQGHRLDQMVVMS